MKDKPAFPCDDPNGSYRAEVFLGLTKREYVATHIMSSILQGRIVFSDYENIALETSVIAVKYADALLKELEKGE